MLNLTNASGNCDNDYKFGYHLSAEVAGLLIVLTTLIICSNLLVIGTAIYDRGLHKLRYAPLISLCTADFLMGLVPAIVLIPAKFTLINQEQLNVAFTFATFVHMASILNLVAVCVERWIAIFKPLRYGGLLKKKNITALIASAWVSAFVLALPFSTFPESKIYSDSQEGLSVEKIYLLVLCGTFFVICIVVGFMQFQIIRLVKRHINKVGSNIELSVTTNEASTSSAAPSNVFNSVGVISRRDFKRREIAIAIAINLTYLSVVFTWTPCVIMIIQIVLRGCTNSCKKGMQFSLFLIYLNCLINPIIYAIRIRDFRSAICKLLSNIPGFQRCFPARRDAAAVTDTIISRMQRRSVVSGPESNTLPVFVV